jgi:hypothetical protein
MINKYNELYRDRLSCEGKSLTQTVKELGERKNKGGTKKPAVRNF